jgi:DNA-binding protein HU-beta
MNKTDLVAAVAEKTGLTKKQSELAVNAVVEAIETALRNGERVSLVGFGTFEVRARRARAGRNPATGQPIRIPAGKVPAFRPGKTLRDAVR